MAASQLRHYRGGTMLHQYYAQHTAAQTPEEQPGGDAAALRQHKRTVTPRGSCDRVQ
ncbi:TPA: hypothetical protein OT855_004632 [Serratia liquefaciens]|nr:hypothetical protein [Serratia liquefaciens]